MRTQVVGVRADILWQTRERSGQMVSAGLPLGLQERLTIVEVGDFPLRRSWRRRVEEAGAGHSLEWGGPGGWRRRRGAEK